MLTFYSYSQFLSIPNTSSPTLQVDHLPSLSDCAWIWCESEVVLGLLLGPLSWSENAEGWCGLVFGLCWFCRVICLLIDFVCCWMGFFCCLGLCGWEISFDCSFGWGLVMFGWWFQWQVSGGGGHFQVLKHHSSLIVRKLDFASRLLDQAWWSLSQSMSLSFVPSVNHIMFDFLGSWLKLTVPFR